MHVASLSLTNYRTYRSLDLTLGPGLTVVSGGNGQGKSNLLEALYMLAIGKSYRAGTERELISWRAAQEGGYAMASAVVERHDGPSELRIGLDSSQTGALQKRVRVNGAPKRASELVGELNAVLFSAEDLDLVYGSPSGRRRYLDVLLSQVSRRYVQALQRYQRVLSHRNALLRSLRDGRARPDEFAFWDESLCAEAAVVLAARHRAVARLAPLAAGAFGRLVGAETTLDVAYAATVPADGEPSVDDITAALAASRDRERHAGMTLVGPHRDDVSLALNGVEASQHASRGQSRLIALAMRLAEGNLLREARGESPVLLLDDVLSELDERRRAQVLDEVADAEQVIVSTAELGLLPTGRLAGARVLRVEAGALIEEAVA